MFNVCSTGIKEYRPKEVAAGANKFCCRNQVWNTSRSGWLCNFNKTCFHLPDCADSLFIWPVVFGKTMPRKVVRRYLSTFGIKKANRTLLATEKDHVTLFLKEKRSWKKERQADRDRIENQTNHTSANGNSELRQWSISLFFKFFHLSHSWSFAHLRNTMQPPCVTKLRRGGILDSVISRSAKKTIFYLGSFYLFKSKGVAGMSPEGTSQSSPQIRALLKELQSYKSSSSQFLPDRYEAQNLSNRCKSNAQKWFIRPNSKLANMNLTCQCMPTYANE